MLGSKSLVAGAVAALAATHATAQAIAPPDPPFSLVAPAERLTVVGVFMDADPVMKLLFAGLVLAAVAALLLWIVHALRPRRGVAAAIAYLSALGAAGPLIGFFGSAYVLLAGFIGMSNVRPAPSLSILAPGFAEATLAAALGLLAAAIAVIGQRHLKARLHALGQAAEATAAEPAPPVSRQVRLAG